MANKVRLFNKDDVTLYPSVSVDNLVAGVGDATPVSVPILDSKGLIPTAYLPSAVDDVVELLDFIGNSDAKPATPQVGDNILLTPESASPDYVTNILTCVTAGTWTGAVSVLPEKGKLYVNLQDEKTYRWSGTLMLEISKQVSITLTVRASASAANNIVPSEKAVRSAIDTGLSGKADSVHTHTKSQITDFPTSLKNPTAFVITLNGGTTEGTNKVTYDGSAAKTLNVTPANIGAAEVAHPHTIADITSLQASLNAKSDTGHPHTIANVTGLQAALDAKQAKLTAGTNMSISGSTINCTYTLPTATVTGIGGVKIGAPAQDAPADVAAAAASVYSMLAQKQATLTAGSGISISGTTIACTYTYNLPTASATILGGVKIGSNVSVASGVISVATGSASVLGVVKISTTASNGVSLAIASGTVSVTVVTATTSVYGTTKLTNDIAGGLQTLAATPKGVKDAIAAALLDGVFYEVIG